MSGVGSNGYRDEQAEFIERVSGGAVSEREAEVFLQQFAYRWARLFTIDEKWKLAKKMVGSRSSDAAKAIKVLDTISEAFTKDVRRG